MILHRPRHRARIRIRSDCSGGTGEVDVTAPPPPPPPPLPPASISVVRQSSTQFTATASPTGGSFSYASSPICTFNCPLPSPSVAYAQGVTAQVNPNSAVLSNPANPCSQQVPCPGSLAIITAIYEPPSPYLAISIDANFQVATFGLSCYYTTTQQQWGTAPNSCGTTTIEHVT